MIPILLVDTTKDGENYCSLENDKEHLTYGQHLAKKLIHRRAGTLRIVVLLDEQASPS